MNLIIVLIVVLILLYAISQVIPISGILPFVLFVGLAIHFEVKFKRRRQNGESKETAEAITAD